MYILKTIPHETIWGGEKLKRYSNNACDRIGHLYSLFDDPEWSNIILNGDYKGIDIHTFFSENRDKLGLSGFERFPVVLAIVEAADSLSIQVHPDDTVARELEGAAWGKNESWFFIGAPEEGWIYGGCTCDNHNDVHTLLDQNRGGEIADKVTIMQGDYVYVPAGTLHAMTTGSFVYEIEENSEYTYRFYDYDRRDSEGNKRELHIDKAMKALHPNNTPVISRYSDEEIQERLYYTRLLDHSIGYTNVSDTIECITALNPDCKEQYEGADISFGTTVLMLPGESMNMELGRIMMARPKGINSIKG
ncbi:MAG: class I mannose-6-phosphate isomerase [Lachnospiraceae bacterium]|nr:class I mannose-6-phosphate isomerase [Lachnospiraceae bacterium]